ncbi:hypothetical protein FOZ60_005345 [Perkinsus olseni]|uniref:Hexosyltransferase n=1 Tax=Perkinsus olseni TaxID=32597 RepID=A0A7J6NS00_PEROL|nr:hypothetical protein FOZ60_005345 [Perkinsus olseni]
MGRGPSCYYRLLLFLLLLADYLGLSRAAEDHQQQQPPAAALHGSVVSEGYDDQDDQQQQQQQEAYDWDLVIVIPSHITEFSRRCAVRDGWARQLRGHEQNNRAGLRTIKLVFTVGAHYPGNSTRDTAMAEMKQFGDMMQLPQWFEDRYDALGTKVRLSFQRVVDKLGRFRLLLKADTDSFIHVDRLLDFIDQHDMWNKQRVYAGSFRHAPVMWEPENKDHKWFDGKFTQMTGLTQYPWNAQGGGYVISYDLAKYLAHPPLQLKSWTHEDVGVGAWLMSLDHERIDMPVSYAEPECGCGAECWSGPSIPEPVIDHYVPEYLQRWRQRRYEIFGDSCWTPGKDDALPSDLIVGDKKGYPPTIMGVLKHRYYFTPLMAYGDDALVDDHYDTRSGICGIDFSWDFAANTSTTLAGGDQDFLSRADAAITRLTSNELGMMVCRGSDGYLYDQLECAASTHDLVSDDDDDDWKPLTDRLEPGAGVSSAGLLRRPPYSIRHHPVSVQGAWKIPSVWREALS